MCTYNDIIKYCFDDGRSVQIFNLNYAILSFHASAIYCNSLFNQLFSPLQCFYDVIFSY